MADKNVQRSVFAPEDIGTDLSERTRSFDWAHTPVGPAESWPQSLRTTIDIMLSSRHPMFLWWGKELIQFYNDAYRPSLGDRHPEALGEKGRVFWSEIWMAIGPQIEAVLTRGESTWHEDHLVPITRNGRVEDVYWTYSYSPVRDDDGNVAGVLVTVQETTERVRALQSEKLARQRAEGAEARLTEVFRQAPAFICVLRGPEHVYEFANEVYLQLVGGRKLIGLSICEALPETIEQGFVALLDNVYATGESFVGDEVLLRIEDAHGNMRERFVTFVYQALVDADGNRTGVFVHGMDVTTQVLARAELERARAEADAARLEAEKARAAAQNANEAKSEFLATMSHELRTPLNAIQGHVQLIEMGLYGDVTEKQLEALARVKRAQQHLLGLINDVLNYARLESGNVEYHTEAVNVRAVIDDVSPMIEQQLASREISYELLLPDEEVFVLADREKLVQVLLNLLSNSAKFTAAGGRITVEVGVRSDGSQPPDLVYLRVSDTGIGISRDKLEAVFEPFVQVKPHVNAITEGTGLGLAISRDLARGMGGDLRARSTPGVATTFTVTLKRAAAPK